MRKLVDSKRFFEQAARNFFQSMSLYHEYQRLFPNKISIFQDCVEVKDVSHFN